MTRLKLTLAAAAAIALLLVVARQREVAVEPVDAGESIVSKDTQAFLQRWLDATKPVVLLAAALEGMPPPAAKVVTEEATTPPAVVVAEKTAPKKMPLDVCQRHHMKKVYTRGGKSWRCKR